VEYVRAVVQEKFKFTAGCEIIPLKLDVGTISKSLLSVLSGTSGLKVGCVLTVSKRKNKLINNHIFRI
jgi:hypothetical protein